MDSSKYVISKPLMIPYTFEGKNIQTAYCKTVKDLIYELSKYDENLPVMMNNCNPIDKVILNQEHYFGDPANPECKVGPAIELI